MDKHIKTRENLARMLLHEFCSQIMILRFFNFIPKEVL